MRIEYCMPALGADMDSGTVVEWRIQAGSTVHRGDVVAVVETDKGAIDVEIFEDGVVAEILVQVGTKVPVGTPLAVIEVERSAPSPASSGEGRGEGLAPSPASSGEGRGEGLAPSPASAGEGRGEGSAPSPASAGEGRGEGHLPSPPAGEPAARASAPEPVMRVRISPAARVRALELGVDLASLVGSGPEGAITRDDVERAIQGRPSPPPSPARAGEGAEPSPPTSPTRAGEGDRKAMREAIAASMSRSKREIPHYYLSLTADVTASVEWLAARNAAVPATERLLFAALLVKAVALACRHEKGFSGFYRDGRYEEAPAANVGVAVAIRGGGLVAPAILDTAAKPLPVLMQEFRDIVLRARAGRLKASELAAPTIILTSLGDSPVEAVFPIIQPPQVAIVGAGAVLPRPWVHDGQLAIRQLCTLSLAADHRVTDGRLGAQFLGHIARLVAAPGSPEWGQHT